ncbi:MAG TPA: hypothetical protein PLB87_05770, partial [Prolixibacteraceae bacterium]|nr:hypothetical protein [Prolixibacteraceae bacterium]
AHPKPERFQNKLAHIRISQRNAQVKNVTYCMFSVVLSTLPQPLPTTGKRKNCFGGTGKAD